MAVTIEATEQAYRSASHVADGFGLAALLSAAWWWQFFDANGHTILLILGIVYALQRIIISMQIILRNHRRTRR